MWCVMPRDKVSSGFFRIQNLVALGLAALSALSIDDGFRLVNLSPVAPRSMCVLLGVLAFVGSVLWTLERRRGATIAAFALAVISMILLLAKFAVAESELPVALTALAELTSALLLGGAVTAMLLGHWYLTAPTMSIAPLHRLNASFGATGVMRLVVSAGILAMGFGHLATKTHAVWLVLRWLAGILGPLVVCVMVWRILKYRNTQSATGVLFTGVILVFIGEMTAALLQSDLKLPM